MHLCKKTQEVLVGDGRGLLAPPSSMAVCYALLGVGVEPLLWTTSRTLGS